MTERSLTLTLALAMLVAFALPRVALAKDKLRFRADLVNTGAEPVADGKDELCIKRKSGHLPSTFDPRAKLVTVERAGTTYLQIVFPNP